MKFGEIKNSPSQFFCGFWGTLLRTFFSNLVKFSQKITKLFFQQLKYYFGFFEIFKIGFQKYRSSSSVRWCEALLELDLREPVQDPLPRVSLGMAVESLVHGSVGAPCMQGWL